MVDLKSCPNCGAPNLPDAQFCASCGAAFFSGAASPSDTAPLAPSSPSPQQPPYSPSPQPRTVFGLSQKTMVIGIIVLFLLLTLGCVALMSNSSPSSPTPTPVSKATTAPTATVKATATKAAPTATPAKATATPGAASNSEWSMTAKYQGIYTESNPYEQPTAGDKYVQIYVELTNKGASDALMGNQFQFTMFDNKNIGHDPATASFGAQNNLQSLQHSNPGDKVAGVIIFEMPAGNTPTKLVYEPSILSSSLTVTF